MDSTAFTSQALQELEALYEAAPVGLALLDGDLRFARVNQKFADLTGLPVGALLGWKLSDALPELACALAPPVHRVLKTGQPIYDVEMSGETPTQQGVVRNWIEHFYPVTAEDGSVAAVGVIVREVTDRKRAETALRERTERYELIAAGACDAIWDWDVLNHRVFYSPRWKELRGFGPDDLSNSEEEWRSRIHPEDAPRVLAAVEVHFAGKSAFFEEEYRIRCKDGSWKWVLDRGIAQWDAAGQVVRMAGSEADITERKHAEEALRMSEGRLRQFIDAAPAPIAMFDREMRYIAASRRFKMDYHLEGQEVVGQCHYDVFPEIPQHWRDVHQRCLQGAVENSPGERFIRGDSSVNWARWEIQPWYDAQEEIGGIILFTEDITERKEAEEAVRRAVADADRANREKADFLLAVSHDIRQPLQTLSFLQEVLAGKIHDPEMRELLGNQAATIAVMTETINTLLDIDRLESGAVQPRFTDVALGALLERLRDEFEDRARARLLNMRTVPTSRIVRTDPVLLARILQNLLSNAIKYTKAGRVLLGCRRCGARLRIEVWDSGPGIRDDQIELIFEKYHQGDVGEETNRHGFGLGLSLVRQLCQLLGHEVAVCSAFGKGSMFSISLPLSERIQPTREPSVPAARARASILLIEDGGNALDSLGLPLEAEGFEIIVARSNDHALAKIETMSLPPDVVITSCARDGAGPDVVECIRQRSALDIPAIILTDMEPDADIVQPATDMVWMLKPVQAAEIRTVIRHRLGQENGAEAQWESGPDGPGITEAANAERIVYVVDDDPGVRSALAKVLEAHDFPVTTYPSAEAFLAGYRPAPGRLECLVLDVVLSQMTGLELQGVLRQRRIDVPTIIVTGQREMQIATQAMLLGAIDVIEKPLRGEVVVRAVRRAFDAAAQRKASSTRIQELIALCERLTPRERQVMTMLVSGHANKEVAYYLSISERTVEVHRRAVMQKMKAKSFAELVHAAGILGFDAGPV